MAADPFAILRHQLAVASKHALLLLDSLPPSLDQFQVVELRGLCHDLDAVVGRMHLVLGAYGEDSDDSDDSDDDGFDDDESDDMQDTSFITSYSDAFVTSVTSPWNVNSQFSPLETETQCSFDSDDDETDSIGSDVFKTVHFDTERLDTEIFRGSLEKIINNASSSSATSNVEESPITPIEASASVRFIDPSSSCSDKDHDDEEEKEKEQEEQDNKEIQQIILPTPSSITTLHNGSVATLEPVAARELAVSEHVDAPLEPVITCESSSSLVSISAESVVTDRPTLGPALTLESTTEFATEPVAEPVAEPATSPDLLSQQLSLQKLTQPTLPIPPNSPINVSSTIISGVSQDFPSSPVSLKSLPDDIVRAIADHLNTYDTQNLAKTCTSLRRICVPLSWRRARVQRQLRLEFLASTAETKFHYVDNERPELTTIAAATMHHTLPFKALLRPTNFSWFAPHVIRDLVISTDPLDPFDLPELPISVFPALNSVVLDGPIDALFIETLLDSKFYKSIGQRAEKIPFKLGLTELTTLRRFSELVYATDIAIVDSDACAAGGCYFSSQYPDPVSPSTSSNASSTTLFISTPSPALLTSPMPRLQRLRIIPDPTRPSHTVGPAAAALLASIESFSNLEWLAAPIHLQLPGPRMHSSIEYLSQLPPTVSECIITAGADFHDYSFDNNDEEEDDDDNYIYIDPEFPLSLPQVTALHALSSKTYKELAPHLHLPNLSHLKISPGLGPIDSVHSMDLPLTPSTVELPQLPFPLTPDLYGRITTLDLAFSAWTAVLANAGMALRAMPNLRVVALEFDGLSTPGSADFTPADDVTLKYLMEAAYAEAVGEPLSRTDIQHLLEYQQPVYGVFDPMVPTAGDVVSRASVLSCESTESHNGFTPTSSSHFFSSSTTAVAVSLHFSGTAATAHDAVTAFENLLLDPAVAYSPANVRRYTRLYFLVTFYESLLHALGSAPALEFLKVDFHRFHYASPALQRLLRNPPKSMRQTLVLLAGQVLQPEDKEEHLLDSRVYTTDLMELVPRLPQLYTIADDPGSLTLRAGCYRATDNFLYTYKSVDSFHVFEETEIDTQPVHAEFDGWFFEQVD